MSAQQQRENASQVKIKKPSKSNENETFQVSTLFGSERQRAGERESKRMRKRTSDGSRERKPKTYKYMHTCI